MCLLSCLIATRIKLQCIQLVYESLSRDLQESEVIRHESASERGNRKNRRVKILGVDRGVITNVAVGHRTIMEF
jgi:hypothetical protein